MENSERAAPKSSESLDNNAGSMNPLKNGAQTGRRIKKRKMENSNSPTPKKPNADNKKPRSASAAIQGGTQQHQTQQTPPQGDQQPPNNNEVSLTSKPPTPIVADISMFSVSQYIRASSHQFNKEDYTILNKPSTNGKGVLIRCASAESKTLIENILKDKQVQFHSFTEANDKSVQFVLKGFDFEQSTTEILESLKANDVPATKVSVLFKGNEKSAPVFIVQFDKSATNLADLNHRFKRIDHASVSWEKLRPSSRKPTQCHNCQAWGHSSRNCQRKSKCVKCTGEHATADCPRTTKEGSAKCVNCGGEHAASYRGCTAYKSYAALFKSKAVVPKEAKTKPPTTKPPVLNEVNFPPFLKRVSRSAQDRLEEARRKPDIKATNANQSKSIFEDSSMDASDFSSDEEEQTKLVSTRKPTNNLESRFRESMRFLKEDPETIRAKEAFCSLIDQLKSADELGKIAIFAKYPFLANV